MWPTIRHSKEICHFECRYRNKCRLPYFVIAGFQVVRKKGSTDALHDHVTIGTVHPSAYGRKPDLTVQCRCVMRLKEHPKTPILTYLKSKRAILPHQAADLPQQHLPTVTAMRTKEKAQ